MFIKLKELLEAGKITQELANELDGEITTALKELRDESASWRVKYQDLSKNYESVSSAKEELEGKISSFDDAIKKAKEDGKSELVTELEVQKQETQKLQQSLASIEEQNKVLKIDSALSTALSKYDVIDNELVCNYLKVVVALDGDTIKYKDGENSLTLDDGLKKFFETKPHLLKVQGQSGSGANNGGNEGNQKEFSQMTLDEKSKLFRENPELYKRLKGGN